MNAILGVSVDDKTIADFSVTTLTGEPLQLSAFAGRVVVVVNVASQCGMTPQYADLETLWRTYRDRGLTIIGCPCDQFGNQEPGTEAQIMDFCSRTYDVTFPMTAKLEVNGSGAHPLWTWMSQSRSGMLGTTAVKWNFTKFLIGRDGKVIERFAPTDPPDSMVPAIERALGISV